MKKELRQKWALRSRRVFAAAVPLTIAIVEITSEMGYSLPDAAKIHTYLTFLGAATPQLIETGSLFAAGLAGFWSLARPDRKKEALPAKLTLLPTVPWSSRKPGQK